MKTITIILLSLLFAKSCDSKAQQDMKNTNVEYTASTRGYYQHIVITNQTIAVSSERDSKTIPTATKISTADWKILVDEFQKLKLDNIKDLVAPSDKRTYDAAAFAHLKILHQEKKYVSNDFDNGNPPADIAKFTNKVTEIAKKIKTPQ